MLSLLLGGCLTGCTTTSRGNGSYFFSYGTEIEFGIRNEVRLPEQSSAHTINVDKLFGMIQEFYKAGPVDIESAQPPPE